MSTPPPYPIEQLANPTAPWVFDTVMPIIWVLIFVAIVVRTAQRRRFSVPSLLFLAGTTMFWIEWPADWGSYLVYNRDFRLFSGWTSIWYQTYWKPVGVLFGYGLFFGLEGIVLTRGVGAIKRRFAGLNPLVVVGLASALAFYVFDIAAEKLMTTLGWYSYVEPLGPSWHSSKGSLSFVWPALPFLGFAICLGLLLDCPDSEGYFRNEVILGAARVREGWRRESLRLLSWIVTMNVLIFFFQPVVLVVGRSLFLRDSPYVP